MSKEHHYRATIDPVLEGKHRPLWSVMIPTFNCAHYLRDTLTSVLAQDPGPEMMQIEVIDDHSTEDDPEAVVKELGRGRVHFYRQPANVGYIRNFETCLQRSRGRLVHILHGDDYVRDGFYRKLQAAFQSHPDIGAGFCRHIYIDDYGTQQSVSLLEQAESGILENWLEKIASGQRLTTPSIVVKREVYECLGGFDRRFTYAGEDWEMWVRIATQYPVWYEAEPLAVYRVKRAGSLTECSAQNDKLVKEMRQATEIIESYLPIFLPSRLTRQCTRKARAMYAGWALEPVEGMLVAGDWRAAILQIQEALKCSRSPKILHWIFFLLLRHATTSIRPKFLVSRPGPHIW